MFHLDKAYYYGTTRGRSWWRRYAADGWLARGACEMWADEEGLHFRRLMTKTVLTIPFSAIEGIESGRWHAGKWTGVEIMKVVWKKDDTVLVSGFSLAKRKEDAQPYIDMIRKRIDGKEKG